MEFSEQILKRRIAALLRTRPVDPRRPAGLGRDECFPSDTADVSDLLSIIDDEVFLQESYRRILGRECDVSGFVSYLELLRRHVPRRVILLQLIKSEEARQRGIRFTGVLEAGSGTSDRKGFLFFRDFLGRFAALVRDVVGRILLSRFDSIDHKLNFLLREVVARTDGLVTKTDQSLWTLSEKFDAYVAALSQGQSQSRETLAQQSRQIHELCHSVEAAGKLQANIEALLTGLGEELAGQRLRLDRAICGVSRDLDAIRKRIEETDSRRLGEPAKQVLAALEVIRSNTSIVMHEQQRASTLLAEGVTRFATIGDDQRTVITSVNSLGSLTAGKYDAMLAKLAEVGGRIRPPIIPAGSDVLATELEGLIVAVPGNEWRMAAYHAFRGTLEPGLTKYFRRLVKPGTVVVDVGANVGIYTLLAAKLLQGKGKIYSFEPTPRTFTILKDNVQVNGFLETGIIHLHQMAVTDRVGKARLSIFEADCGHNTLFGNGCNNDEIEVETTTLDEILQSEQCVDVVKIDVEGAEPLVIRGMKQVIERNRHVRILLEFAPTLLMRAGIAPRDFLDEIASWGFAMCRIDDESGEPLSVAREELAAAFSVNLQLEHLTNGTPA